MSLSAALLSLVALVEVRGFSPLLLSRQRALPSSSTSALFARRPDPRREADLNDNRSLAEKMFGDVTKIFSFGQEEEEKVVVEQGPLDAGRAINAIDERAASGEITYQVREKRASLLGMHDTTLPPSLPRPLYHSSARLPTNKPFFFTPQDFIAMSRTFAELDGNIPGMPKLSASEKAETKRKFEKHEKIVQAMSPEELQDPQLMVDDIDSINTGETKGPRVQRLAIESGVGEKDVLLFVAEFEAMRESTARIAKGEDPDKVNASLGEGKGNRSQRRATKKAQKKAIKKGSLP